MIVPPSADRLAIYGQSPEQVAQGDLVVGEGEIRRISPRSVTSWRRVAVATKRFWIEAAVACASESIALVTIVWHDWIEFFFRIDPDGGNGALEWAIVTILCSTSIVFGVLARHEWLRIRPAEEGC